MGNTAYTTYPISRFTTGEGSILVNSEQTGVDALNAPLNEIEAALTNLSERVSGLNSKSAIIRYDVPIADTVGTGTLVYFNTATDKYEPAIAELQTAFGEQGQTLESPKSRVEGMIIQTMGVTGTLLCGGYYISDLAAINCLGTDAVAGTYYLSPETAGTAVTVDGTHGHMRQAIISYYGDGAFMLNLFFQAQDSHFHGSLTLSGVWQPAIEGAPYIREGVAIPTGALYVYDPATDPDEHFFSLGELTKSTTAIFSNGVLQSTQVGTFVASRFCIQDGYIWYAGDSAITGASVNADTNPPVTGTVMVFNHYPFSYNSPVVRDVISESDAIQVDNTNGIVRITGNAFIAGNTTNSPTAIAAISDRRLAYTPVVSDIVSGPGVAVTRISDGTAIISSDLLAETCLDAYSINHNGTVSVSDGVFTYLVFPGNRESEMIISLPIPSSSQSAEYNTAVWVEGVGSATLDISASFIPLMPADGDTSLSNQFVSMGSIAFGTSANPGSLSYTEVQETHRLHITGTGMLVARISPSTVPTTDIRIFRIGFKLYPVTGAISSIIDTDSDMVVTQIDTVAVTNILSAGEAMPQFQPVFAEYNANTGMFGIFKCIASDVTTANRCIGIAIQAAQGTGAAVEYIVSGIIQNSSWNWNIGKEVYIGETKGLTQNISHSTTQAGFKYKQAVGIAVSATSIRIDIKPAEIFPQPEVAGEEVETNGTV